MKIIIKLTFILMSINIFSQKIDSIRVNVDLTNYKEKANLNLKERYNYTLTKLDSLKILFEPYKVNTLTSYYVDSLVVKSIPKFTFKEDTKLCRKKNIVNYIDFNNIFENQYYNIYYDNRIVMNTMFIVDNKYSMINLSLIENDFKDPSYFGGLQGYLMKLQLERIGFVFMIKGIGDAYFISEDNKIFAIYNPDNNGNYDKMEINEFIGKVIGKKKLNLVLKGKHISTIHTDKLNKKGFFKKFFDNGYFDKNYNFLFNVY
ncbi:hypothetical protein [Flavobacterium sp.]|jgi:hypothetical protein|uniref:hypothetical protein n=1 Tax=Flavobacterium sp. TaxID=239 RepID=UPI0037C0829E